MERSQTIIPVINKSFSPRLSMHIEELRGMSSRTSNSSCVSYLCIKGVTTFVFGGIENKSFLEYKTLQEGQTIRISPNTPHAYYSSEGTRVIVVTSPGFDQKNVKTLEMRTEITEKIK